MTGDRSIPLFLIVAVIAVTVAIVRRPEPTDHRTSGSPVETKTSFQEVCAACHGSRGEGNRGLGAPTIASLPEWFITEQLAKFRDGLRGGDPRDVGGQQMRAAVLPLTKGALDEAVAELLALPVITPPPTLGGDIKEGEILYRELCMECHRYNGHGELSFKSSPLAGLPDWYLATQFTKFLDGSRGAHPDDEAGAKMREMARRPRNDEEIANILSYISTLSREFPLEK